MSFDGLKCEAEQVNNETANATADVGLVVPSSRSALWMCAVVCCKLKRAIMHCRLLMLM